METPKVNNDSNGQTSDSVTPSTSNETSNDQSKNEQKSDTNTVVNKSTELKPAAPPLPTALNPMMMPPMMPPMNFPMMPPMNPLFPGAPMMPFMPGLTPTHSPTNTANQPKVCLHHVDISRNYHNSSYTLQAGKRCGDWQSYITDKGKTYYFNLKTKENTWDKPEEFAQDEKENTDDTKSKPSHLGTADTKELAVVTDTVAKRSFGSKNKSKYKGKKDRIAAFRSLLHDKQIGADWPWKKVLPKIVSDKRYNALTKLDDKKHELIQWQLFEYVLKKFLSLTSSFHVFVAVRLFLFSNRQ